MALTRTHDIDTRRIGYLMTYVCQMLFAVAYLPIMVRAYLSYFRYSGETHLIHWYDLVPESMMPTCVVMLLVAIPMTMIVRFLCADKSERRHLALGTITTVILILMFVAPRIAQIAGETTRHHLSEWFADTLTMGELCIRTTVAMLMGLDIYAIDRNKDHGWKRIANRLKCAALISLIASVVLTIVLTTTHYDDFSSDDAAVLLLALFVLSVPFSFPIADFVTAETTYTYENTTLKGRLACAMTTVLAILAISVPAAKATYDAHVADDPTYGLLDVSRHKWEELPDIVKDDWPHLSPEERTELMR